MPAGAPAESPDSKSSGAPKRHVALENPVEKTQRPGQVGVPRVLAAHGEDLFVGQIADALAMLNLEGIERALGCQHIF